MAIKTLNRLTPDGQVYYDSEMEITEAFVNPDESGAGNP